MGIAKMPTILDSNVVLDVLQEDPVWMDWSGKRLQECRKADSLLVNAVIFAESCLRYATLPEYQRLLSAIDVGFDPIPLEAAFLAGQAHYQYRQQGGKRERVLADFLIGAHAASKGYRLLTRDAARYRSYFPQIDIIAPDSHP